MKILIVLAFLQVLTLCVSGQSENIYTWAKRMDRYQEWIKQVSKEQVKTRQLLETPIFDLTVFIPTNEAFKSYAGPNVALILSHSLIGVYDKEGLVKLESVKSLDQLRPKLRFSREIDSNNVAETYVMDAKILSSQRVGDSIVHIIDRVLLLPQSSTSIAPSALDLISYSGSYASYSIPDGISAFSSRINSTGSSGILSCSSCTFFVPANTKSSTEPRVSQNVIAGHVIPNQVVFTRNMKNSTIYETKAKSGEMTVTLMKGAQSTPSSPTIIYSTAKGTEKSLKLGTTRVRIVQADIPVENGVVHIIDRPLIVPDSTVLNYLTEESGSSLYQFNKLLDEFGHLRRYYAREDPNRPITVFAFTNEAYELVKNDISLIGRNRTALEDLVRLHLVDDSVITSQNANSIKDKFSTAANKKLHFSVAGDRLYVEGDGVKATAIYQDIICTDGVIHVLNKILGIPSSPINDKLSEDPQFKTTYTVARNVRSDWLKRLGDKSKNFTFFAPSEAAWKKLQDQDPSAYKQLTKGIYPDISMNILNRHLIENQAYSLNNLSSMAKVATVASQVRIESKPGKMVTLKFENIESIVSRPDIKATNGYIHEINTILMLEEDLKVIPQMARDSASPGRISPLVILSAIVASFIKLTLYQI